MREAFAAVGKEIKPCRILLIPKAGQEYGVDVFSRDLKKIFEKEKLLEG